ncbi:MAG: NADH-quinone oxidoreductase subunit L [Dysgonamonadaceae bacterium]|jgi:NADH-quinone oxidoreductase subunit L|nr:NADH-quinone oxidoreductase subunit L [Dysgonamonadaceae bacterium]
MEYSLLIIVTPFILFLALGLLGSKLKPSIAGLIGTLGMTLCAITAYTVAYQYFFQTGKTGESWQPVTALNFQWLHFTDKLHIDLGILLDPISIMMLVVITTVSLMVHIYSLGYMKGETGFQRYYAFLSLFSFSMLGLVVATNIFQMYIFWELVGVSSYSLIGFYYTKPSAVAASKKAFIVTRFADLGFLVGILILSYYTGTFDFAALTADKASLVTTSFAGGTFLGLSLATWALALIFMGGAGKSAMFPLHIWLPDAMEGPTPVSALIHAATMVVAGVYLVARLFPVYFFAAPAVLEMIAFIGAFTALFAAVIAITQTDIKRVLAFSTISQIAYMMVALGVSGYGDDGLGYMASMFHLFTHAFFKALLFLGAGSVIHAVHSNEMGAMGGLHKYMKITSYTFLIACLAIAGIWPFSGFFSKDEILAAAFHHQPVIFWTLWIVAGLTAFYMFRLYFRIFWNTPKSPKGDLAAAKHAEAHSPLQGVGGGAHHHTPHESPAPMAIPLIILAIFSIFTGLIPFADFVSSDNTPFHTHIDWTIAGMSIAVAVIGIAVAFVLYFKDSKQPAVIAQKLGGFYHAALHKFYLDEAWMWFTQTVIFRYICEPIKWFDRHIIDGSMDGLAWITQKSSTSVRGLQSGQVQFYAWVFIAGSIVIAALVLFL